MNCPGLLEFRKGDTFKLEFFLSRKFPLPAVSWSAQAELIASNGVRFSLVPTLALPTFPKDQYLLTLGMTAENTADLPEGNGVVLVRFTDSAGLPAEQKISRSWRARVVRAELPTCA